MNSTTLIPNTPTTIGSWALLIAKALESYNVDSHHVFSEAKIESLVDIVFALSLSLIFIL